MSDTANKTQASPALRLSGAQLIIKLLERQGISHITGIPGGANLPLYDALVDSRIKHVLARHEQGAGFIAQGMARATGQAQVCFASSGPGATNLVTAVADAKMDSIPLVAITGQVSQQMIGTDAFQEIDTFGLMLPITKHNWMVRSAEELLQVIPEAFHVALSGRPGPVSIDVPKDVQNQLIDVVDWPTPGKAEAAPKFDTGQIDRILARIKAAHRPLLMIGGGIVNAGASSLLREFAERLDIPAVQTFMGLGILPPDHPLCLGMLGMHGARYTNLILEECDLLIGLGVRFDDRATGKVEAFCPQADIIHVDIDHSEIGKIKNPLLSIRADVGEVLQALAGKPDTMTRPLWRQRIEQLRQAHPLVLEGADELFRPYGAIRKIAAMLDESVNITTDVGQHQMWVAQAYPIERPRQWASSGGLGTMGFGLPAAIGMALAQPERKTICFTGDGSFMMNIQELATAAEEQLDIKVIVLNNGYLGLVRQQQSLFYSENFNAIEFRQGVDFASAAEAMGVKGIDLGQVGDPEGALQAALAEPGPCVINLPIDKNEMVFPMVAPGGANADMIGGESR
ncbi:MAG: biosynthetic-type acetolactate synthase large subunit [Gammaproteobacteria bacterium]|nr:biosynthetic-type acetolactate synthase large subunit [Gammaproteobacteria bacterium]